MNDENLTKIIDGDDVQGLLTAVQSRPDKTTIEKGLAKKGIVQFTDKEIQTMPKTFRRLIIVQGKRCRMRTRQSGKDTETYEIRYRRHGYNVCACGKTVAKAKANFIEKLKTAEPFEKATGGGQFPKTFTAFALYHLDTFKKEKVSEKHHKNCHNILNRYIVPYFKETPIEKITPPDCKTILDGIKEQGKGKTADEVHSLLNGIFKNAIAHGIIERNPLAIVPHTQHERESGCSLSRAEESILLNALDGDFLTATALALYTGLRPNELETAEIQGDFIKAINSKRKGGKREYKLIPIIDRLRPFLPADNVFRVPNLDMLRRAIKKALPTHKLYDLRTTFYTRCDELGVSPPARDEFVGHSSGVLTNTYRDLSNEYLLKEGEKLNKW